MCDPARLGSYRVPKAYRGAPVRLGEGVPVYRGPLGPVHGTTRQAEFRLTLTSTGRGRGHGPESTRNEMDRRGGSRRTRQPWLDGNACSLAEFVTQSAVLAIHYAERPVVAEQLLRLSTRVSRAGTNSGPHITFKQGVESCLAVS